MGTHADYDRFVLEFDSATWRYQVLPQDNRFPREISPESPITLQGSAGLRVVIHNATNHDEHGVPFEKTFNTEPGFPALRQAVLLEDFEGAVVWGLGIARPSCFATDVLENPSRFVLDIQH